MQLHFRFPRKITVVEQFRNSSQKEVELPPLPGTGLFLLGRYLRWLSNVEIEWAKEEW
jgi:hypothetical protein